MEEFEKEVLASQENAATLSSAQKTAGSTDAIADVTSEEVTADADVDGDETPQNEETTISSSPEVTGFAAAIAAATSGEVASDEDTYSPLKACSGAKFSPSTDENREVKIYTPLKGADGNLDMGRTGSSDSQGGFINHGDVAANFGLDVTQLAKHTQASLVLANGKTLVGYVSITASRKGFYFPKKLAEQTLTLPPSGHRQSIRVITLLIG